MNPIEAAQAAERRLAEIAKTRRPTEAETAEALKAYRAAKRYVEHLKKQGPEVAR